MAINYTPVGWNSSSYYGPTNMNHMDDGIKAACDGVDDLETELAATNESLAQKLSLSGGTAIPQGANLDDYKTEGRYYTQNAAIVSSLSNCPTSLPFTLIVDYALGSNYPRQTIYTYLNGEIHTRSYYTNSSKWWEWDSYVLNSDLAVKHGTLTPANDSLHLVKSGKVCTFSGIYTVGEDLNVGVFGMTSLSFAPIIITDINIFVVGSSSNAVVGGYIDVNGNVFYQVNEPITANTQLRVCGTFITN